MTQSNYCGSDMAQDVLQVSRVRHVAEHEELQGVRQTALLLSVSIIRSFLSVIKIRLKYCIYSFIYLFNYYS